MMASTSSPPTPYSPTHALYEAALRPARYEITFSDGTTARCRTHAEVIGTINTRNVNGAPLISRQTVVSAIKGSQAPWFKRHLAAMHVERMEKLT